MADLISKAFIKVLDLVSEGPIKGWVHPEDPTKDIYLNDTPLKGADGKLNFYGTKDNGDPDYTTIHYDYRLGTADQTYMPGTSAAESAVDVGVKVEQGVPVTRYFSDANLTSVRVMLTWSSLFYQNKEGKTKGKTVVIKIWLQTGSGPFVQYMEDTVSGVSTSQYQKNYLLRLTGSGPWGVRVERVTANDTSLLHHSEFAWSSYTKIVDAKLRYPYSAVVDLSFDAATFSSMPTRAYELYLREVQIPVNYDPVSRDYTGTWNGTFKTAWTDNPAWIWYDLATHPRYGLGQYIDPTMIDKWALYKIGRYCDGVDVNGNYVGVPDGFGGIEPRFTCNLYLTNREEAFKVLNNLASVFRSMIYWDSATLTMAQDSPVADEEKQLFVNANVTGGVFSYQGTSRSARHTVAVVTWNDPADGYRQKVEYVENAEGITRYGVRQIELNAVGCTSRGQAHRLGEWTLYTDTMETETVTFQSGMEGSIVYPGKVIRIQDAHRVSERYGGRIVGGTTTSLTLDAPLNLNPGKSYSIEVMLPDMTMGSSTITNFVGTYSTITLGTALAQVPQPQAVWIVVANDLVPTTWRVLSVKEDEPHLYSVMAVAHNESKFDHIELDRPLQPLPIIRNPDHVPSPLNVTISEGSITTELGVQLTLTFSWVAPAQGLTYLVEWKRGDENWVAMPVVSTLTTELVGVVLDTYLCRVTSIDSSGRKSLPAYSSPYAMVGKTAIPEGIASLFTESGLWEIKLGWSFFPEQYDLKFTEIWVSATNNRSQAQMLPVVPYPGTSTIETNLGNGTVHYFWARTQNTSGVYSEWFPTSPLGGIQGSSLNDAEKILTILSGQIAQSLAGQSLGERLNKLDWPGTGVIHQIQSIQSAIDAVAATTTTLGSRLNPEGALGEAIARAEMVTRVAVPTPYGVTAPANPKVGDSWFNTTTGIGSDEQFSPNEASYFAGSSWKTAATAIQSTTAPANPSVGTLWKDTSSSKGFHRIWDGTVWVSVVRPTWYKLTAPSTAEAYIGDLWFQWMTDVLHVYNGTIWVPAESVQLTSIAASVDTVESTVGTHTTQIQQNMSVVDGIKGLYSVKIDNNGHVAGFAISSQLLPGGSGAFSNAVFVADRFAVTNHVNSPTYPFAVVTTGPDPGVYMKSAFIQDASVGTLKIAGEAITVPRSSENRTVITTPMGISSGQLNYLYMPPGCSSVLLLVEVDYTVVNATEPGYGAYPVVALTLVRGGVSMPVSELMLDTNNAIAGGTYYLQYAVGGDPNGIVRFNKSIIVALGTKR